LLDIMSSNDRTVVISAAMIDSLKLIPIQNKFPKRLFDVGIAEQHAVTMAAGMALEGLKPFVAIYSTFLQRAYDQILHDIVINSLPVVFLIDRAGIVGEDGETHHGIYDMAYLSPMPNLILGAPSCRSDLAAMIRIASVSQLPFAIRYPKDPAFELPGSAPMVPGKASRIKEGLDLTILSVGTLLEDVLGAAAELETENIFAEVIDVRFIKPLDEKTIIDSVRKTGKVITIEDGVLTGGFASCVNSLIKNMGVEIINMGIENDNIITHATRKELLDSVKINLQNIKINAKILHYSRKETRFEKSWPYSKHQ
jgi:1-deoxy-D-xylulose-5-phosphate synthase